MSVVIATRNRAERLGQLLAALRDQELDDGEFEVIVVDDGSTDRTSEVLRAAAADGLRLRCLKHEPGGPARARNAGWRLASGPLIAFTDDDCVPGQGWLRALLDAAERRPGAAIQGRTEILPGEASTIGPFSRILEVTEPSPFYATCNIAYPRSLLARLGGFDEGYSFRGEDTDLGWRAVEQGARVEFESRALVYHAVVQLGPVGKLGWLLRWSDAMEVFARHAELRKVLTWGVFWKRSHGLLLLATLGALVATRFRPAALLVLPYLRVLRARCIVDGYSPAYIPYLALCDTVETFAAARGAVRHRVPVL